MIIKCVPAIAIQGRRYRWFQGLTYVPQAHFRAHQSFAPSSAIPFDGVEKQLELLEALILLELALLPLMLML